MAKRYRVTGAYVTVKTDTTNGPMVVGLYEGAPVPADASEAWIAHHLANNLIEEVPQAEAKAEPVAAAPPGPPPAHAPEHEPPRAGRAGKG
jgi:hypothetical protein